MADYLAQEVVKGSVRALEDNAAEISHVKSLAASLLGSDVQNTGFGVGTVQLWTKVASHLPMLKGRILVSAYEWGEQVRFLERLARPTDCEIEVVPNNPDGSTDLTEWAARIDEDVIAICLPLVSSVAGVRTPVNEILDLDRPDHTVTIIDAAQAIGRVDLSDGISGCDVLVATARKWLRGPRQTAIFSLSFHAQETLGLRAADIEGADVNVALRLGLGMALSEVFDAGIDTIHCKIERLETQLRTGLRDAGFEVVQNGSETVGTICVRIPAQQKKAVVHSLEAAHIVAKWPDAQSDEPFAPYCVTQPLLRLSPHCYNTPEDIERLLDALVRA